MKLAKIKEYSPAVLRIAMALVFFWFGITQLINPGMWVGYIPDWLTILPAATFVIINGIFEIVFAALLITGIFTRIVSLVLGLHLLFIGISIGYNAVAIRDIGLALATLSVSLHGPDKLCIMKKSQL